MRNKKVFIRTFQQCMKSFEISSRFSKKNTHFKHPENTRNHSVLTRRRAKALIPLVGPARGGSSRLILVIEHTRLCGIQPEMQTEIEIRKQEILDTKIQ
ncbi:hypothetical protein HanRHA438_Chr08g0349671 [Helianthus annuus]|nr:hypothetical protein HanRHA438_Chr08g0349671 [Helianthus annuus]